MRQISEADREQLKALRAVEREAIRAERQIRNAADLEQIRRLRAAEREAIKRVKGG
jgi:hypothetical protein